MEATLGGGTAVRGETRHFHLWMACVFALIAFGGFTPTYWAKIASGSFHAPPIVHIHGMLLFAWTLFYLTQTALVAAGRTPAHRASGLGGIALFSVLVCSITAARIVMMRLDDAHGMGVASRSFSAVVFLALPLMVGLFATAIANIRRPEVHKRFMYVLMASMMIPAIARVFLTFLAPAGAADGPPPAFVSIPPAVVSMLLIVVAMVYDWRTRGRPHTAYVIGGSLVLIYTLLVVPVATSQTWQAVALYLEHIPG